MKILISIFIIFICLTKVSVAQDTLASQIIKKADEKFRGKKSVYAEMIITSKRPKWSRERTMKSWSKGNDYSLMLVTSPAKEKGITYLKRKKEVWNWIPSIERSIKLPPSMMLQSWMGTDFTNDDLLKESSNIIDYTSSVVNDSVVINSRVCWKLKLIPKENAAVVWGKVILFIDQTDYLQLRAEYYDEDGILINVMKSSKIKTMGGQKFTSKMEMIPKEKKGNKTIIEFTKIEFDKPMDDDFFTIQNMKKISK